MLSSSMMGILMQSQQCFFSDNIRQAKQLSSNICSSVSFLASTSVCQLFQIYSNHVFLASLPMFNSFSQVLSLPPTDFVRSCTAKKIEWFQATHSPFKLINRIVVYKSLALHFSIGFKWVQKIQKKNFFKFCSSRARLVNRHYLKTLHLSTHLVFWAVKSSASIVATTLPLLFNGLLNDLVHLFYFLFFIFIFFTYHTHILTSS